MRTDLGLLGVFVFVDDLLSCLRMAKEKGYPVLSVFSPVRLPEMQDLVSPRPSLTRLFTLIGGIVGGSALVGLAAYAHLSFRLVVWGKPVLAWVPWVVVAFEGTILMASLCAFVSWVFKSGLPRPDFDPGYDTLFSGHRFAVLLETTAQSRAEMEQFLEERGAEEVRVVSS